MAMETSFYSEQTFDQEGFRRWLEQLPGSDVNHYELVRGRIVMSPPAGGRHGSLELRVGALILAHVDAHRLGRAFGPSTGYELPSGETLQPDCSYISRERWEEGPKPSGDEFLRIVPSLVVEILSPSTARRDRTEKVELYAQNGVDEYWIIDPRRREVILYSRSASTPGHAFDDPLTLATGIVPSAVLPDLEATVEGLFTDLG
jgi:Uma2 family endonuclease